MKGNQRWQDLSGPAKTALVAFGIGEAALTAIAARDLAHRLAEEVRGPKGLWWSVLLIQPIGPVAYLIAGRHGAKAPIRLARRVLGDVVDVTVTAGPCDSEDLVAATDE